MCSACLRAAGGARAERWKFFTLTIACHEGHPPVGLHTATGKLMAMGD
jgi:hypothetical protein